MHITALPPHSEAEFLKALTQGANGAFFTASMRPSQCTHTGSMVLPQNVYSMSASQCSLTRTSRRSGSCKSTAILNVRKRTPIKNPTDTDGGRWNRCTLRPGSILCVARPGVAHLARDDQNRSGPRAIPLRDERGPALPRHRRRGADVARTYAGRPPLLRLLQRARDLQGQARERAAKGTRLPPGFSRVDAQLARRVVGLEFARDRIRLVRCPLAESPNPLLLPSEKKKTDERCHISL
jgi:hypothetical protein